MVIIYLVDGPLFLSRETTFVTSCLPSCNRIPWGAKSLLSEWTPFQKWDAPAHDKTYKMACAPSEDLEQLRHPPSLIRVFAVRMKKAWALIRVFTVRMKKAWALSYPFSTHWSDWADAQPHLSYRWAHMPFCWFCHALVQMESIPLKWFCKQRWNANANLCLRYSHIE